MFSWRHIHFTGIGGAGMSALAHLMLQYGVKVTGSDLESGKSVKKLQKMGAEINIGHADFIPPETDLLVYSSAVPEENPELVCARQLGIRIIKRGAFLAEVAAHFETIITVAGSHGKTTVTSMISHILRHCGKNPDYVIGGTPAGRMPAASHGAGKIFVTEADESDRSLEFLKPTIGVVVNVEDDHSWSTGGKARLFEAFANYANKSETLVYGAGVDADIVFKNHPKKIALSFESDQVDVPQPGQHNRFNGAIAVKVAELVGVDREQAKVALQSFQGVSRRCTMHGQGNNFILLEDYAHHPTELQCFANTLEESFKDYEKVIVFQPHRFERVEHYGEQFAEILKRFKNVYITPPFAAWNKEKEHRTETMAKLAGATYFETIEWEILAATTLKNNPPIKPTVYTIIGAASVEKVIPILRDLLRKTELETLEPDLELTRDLTWGDLTTLSIGNYNPLVAIPDNEEQLQTLLKYAHRHQLNCLPLGCGSNMVGGDEIYDGIILRMKKGVFSDIIIHNNLITAGAGVRLNRFVNTLAEQGIGGAEALVAIPGSVGGALRMNAGAQKIETSDFVEEVHGVRMDGTKYFAKGSEIVWDYRSCSIPVDVIITKAVFRLQFVDKNEAKEKIETTRYFRKTTQPGGKNPGCAFRNPGNDSAGRLIDRYGLKNFSIGACTVSEVHANFIVNNGGGTEEDYAKVLEHIQRHIFEKCGIVLENEVVFSTGRKIMNVKPLNIVVLKGGPSSEREISLKSGAAVAQALRDGGHLVTEIDLTERAVPNLPKETDLVFPVLHGEFGEDGEVQTILDKRGIPYVGTGASASRITIDKYATTSLLQLKGVDTPKSVKINRQSPLPPIAKFPVIVKPNSQGSTIGMSIVNNLEELTPALEKAFAVDPQVLIEEYVKGQETTVGLLDGKALPVVEIIPPDGFFDYDAKYTYAKGQTIYNCPPEKIPESVQKRMQEIAEKCFKICDARHLLRVDMIWQKENDRIVVLEVNTMPGFTASSLLPKSAKAVGYSFTELCCQLAIKALKK